jgi:hypothetical protein
MTARYVVTRTRTEWWERGAFASEPGREVRLSGERTIGVDPALSSPNVLVGLSLQAGGDPVYLRPGEHVTFAQPVNRVLVFNAEWNFLIRDFTLGGETPVPMLGSVVLAAGDPAAFVQWRSDTRRPGPFARLLAARRLPAGPHVAGAPGADGIAVVTSALRKLRLQLWPLTAAGGPIGVPPADLAGTLKLARALAIALDGGASFDAAIVHGQDIDSGAWANADPGDLMAYPDGALSGENDDASDKVIGPAQLVFTYEGAALGGVVCPYVPDLAGAGVASLLCFAEGE